MRQFVLVAALVREIVLVAALARVLAIVLAVVGTGFEWESAEVGRNNSDLIRYFIYQVLTLFQHFYIY